MNKVTNHLGYLAYTESVKFAKNLGNIYRYKCGLSLTTFFAQNLSLVYAFITQIIFHYKTKINGQHFQFWVGRIRPEFWSNLHFYHATYQ